MSDNWIDAFDNDYARHDDDCKCEECAETATTKGTSHE